MNTIAASGCLLDMSHGSLIKLQLMTRAAMKKNACDTKVNFQYRIQYGSED